MSRCGVCKKITGSGCFECCKCLEDGQATSWTHPKCGGYKKREVQTNAQGKVPMWCNNCKQVCNFLPKRSLSWYLIVYICKLNKF